jgi:hypothetical protein
VSAWPVRLFRLVLLDIGGKHKGMQSGNHGLNTGRNVSRRHVRLDPIGRREILDLLPQAVEVD